MSRPLTMKQKAFVKETVKTRNPAEAVRRVYNLGGKHGITNKKGKNQTASAMAHENMRKPEIKKALELQESKSGLTDDEARDILNRNATQTKSIAASNQAVDMHHKLDGNYAPEKRMNVNVSTNVEDLLNSLKTSRGDKWHNRAILYFAQYTLSEV